MIIKKYGEFITEDHEYKHSRVQGDIDYMVDSSVEELVDEAPDGGIFDETYIKMQLDRLRDDRDIYADFGEKGFDDIYKNINLMASGYLKAL